MGSICSQLDDELTKEIQESVEKSVAKIPKSYANERERIVKSMQQAAPRPYENLLFSDYPEKNGSKVNALAWTNVTSKTAKEPIVDEINEKMQRRVDEKTAGQDLLIREAMRKATRKAIEKLVDETIDQLSKNIDNMITQTK